MYFWLDHLGNEIDVILEQALSLTPIEMKAGKTVSSYMFKQFTYVKGIKNFPSVQKFVLYGGTETQSWPDAKVLGWQQAGNLIKSVTTQSLHKK